MKRIVLEGIVGWDITARALQSALDELNGEDVVIQVYSPGGSVYEGIQLYNVIKDYTGHTTSEIGALGASAASYFPLAADKVVARFTSTMFIHNAWGCACGNAAVFREYADILDGLSGLIADIYVKKTGKNKKEIIADMDKELFIFGGQALVEYGLVDEVQDPEDEENVMTTEQVKTEIDEMLSEVAKNEVFQNEYENLKNLVSPSAKIGVIQSIKNVIKGKKEEKHISSNKEEYMDMKAFFESNPEAKLQYDADLNAAKLQGENSVDLSAAVAEARGNEQKRIIGIANLEGVVLPENVSTAIVENTTTGAFAEALILAKKENPAPAAPKANGDQIAQINPSPAPADTAPDGANAIDEQADKFSNVMHGKAPKK